MIAAVITLCVIAAAVLGFVLGRATAVTPETRRLRQHERLTLRAARAARRGRTGMSNVYAEAAARMIEPPGDGDAR